MEAERLARPEHKSEATELVLNHVLAGRVFGDQAAKSKKLRSLAQNDLVIAGSSEGRTIAGVTILELDSEAKNGLVHAVDALLLPR